MQGSIYSHSSFNCQEAKREFKQLIFENYFFFFFCLEGFQKITQWRHLFKQCRFKVLLKSVTFSFNLLYLVFVGCGRFIVWTTFIPCKCEHITKHLSLKASVTHPFWIITPRPPPCTFLVFQMVFQVASGFGVLKNGCTHRWWQCHALWQCCTCDTVSPLHHSTLCSCSLC